MYKTKKYNYVLNKVFIETTGKREIISCPLGKRCIHINTRCSVIHREFSQELSNNP